MFSEDQLIYLEGLIQDIDAALHIEEVTLEAQHTLKLILCNDTTCFRPLYLTAAEVNIPAVLNGQPEAQQTFQARLRSALHGSI